jgi:hypothetical protein
MQLWISLLDFLMNIDNPCAHQNPLVFCYTCSPASTVEREQQLSASLTNFSILEIPPFLALSLSTSRSPAVGIPVAPFAAH